MRRPFRAALAAAALGAVLTSAGTVGSAVPVRTLVHLDARAWSAALEISHSRPEALPLPSMEFDGWRGTSFGGYMAPKWGAECDQKRTACFVGVDGGVDLVFHFNAAMVVEREWKESGANAIIASAAFGAYGTAPYADAFSDPGRFDRMVKETLASVEEKLPKDASRPRLHVRRIGLVAWSAGFAAISKILGVDGYYARTDSVVLLDGLHASYMDPDPRTGGQGEEKVDVRGLAGFIRFAKDARLGKKTFVITHSSIIPPEYAGTTETTSALLREAGATRRPVDREPCDRDMLLVSKVDDGGLHVRGFAGASQKTHMDHLHLVGQMVKTYVAPRWR